VAVVPDRVIRRLNRRFAARDAVTDVLAFPAGQDPAPETPAPLGEIVVAIGRAAQQARESGHSLRTELRLLVLHGLLHLLGFDHHGDDGRMARVERRLRRLGGLDTGLIERAVRP
jgi:probable rRNA maturation factor